MFVHGPVYLNQAVVETNLDNNIAFLVDTIPVFFYLFGMLYSYVLELYRNVHTKDDVDFCEKISLAKKKFVK